MDIFLILRILAATTFLLMAIVGISFRIKARKAGDETTWKEEGPWIMIGLRLTGFGTWLAVIMTIAIPKWISWSLFPISPYLSSIGFISIVSGILLMYFLFKSIGKNITDTVGTKADHQLITTGPYRYIRHPLYSASLVVFTGYGLLLGNWLIPALGCLAFLFLTIRLAREEANLIDAFGEDYLNYMKQTPRFIPRWRS